MVALLSVARAFLPRKLFFARRARQLSPRPLHRIGYFLHGYAALAIVTAHHPGILRWSSTWPRFTWPASAQLTPPPGAQHFTSSASACTLRLRLFASRADFTRSSA
eukprot:7737706-Pyramimonas_sp.AAC.1